MFLTKDDVRILTEEIRKNCEGGIVQKVSLLLPTGVQLTVRSKKATKRILLFDSPHFPSALVASNSWELLSRENTQFLQLSKKYINGKKILSIEQFEGDRIVSIKFEGCSLIIECIERFANILLLNSDNNIIAAHLNLRKPLVTNLAYVLPEGLQKDTFSKRTLSDEKNPSSELFLKIKEKIEEQFKQNELKKIAKEVKKKEELIYKLQGDLEKVRLGDSFRKEGELLKSVIHTIPHGAKSVEVMDYESSPPQKITVKLDPKINPQKYVESLFQKYKKLKRSQDEIVERLNTLHADLEKLKQKLGKIESNQIKAAASFPTKPKKHIKAESGPRVFCSSDGFSIFVARNVVQGTKLVRQSKGNDLWLHVLNAPGPHVIISRLHRKPVPHQTILEAAALALFFSSKGRDEKGDVSVAERRYIKILKGDSGKVTYTRSETVSIRIDEKKLKPLLDSALNK